MKGEGERPGTLILQTAPETGSFGLNFGWTVHGLVIAKMEGVSGGINVHMEGNMSLENARALYYSLGVNIRNAEEALGKKHTPPGE